MAMAAHFQAPCELPSPVYVKNTFLDVLEAEPATEPAYKSCPADWFAGEGAAGPLGGLAAMARAFAGGEVTREALEAAGHLAPRAGKAGQEDASDAASTTGPSSGDSSAEDEEVCSSAEDAALAVGPEAPPSWSPRLPALPAAEALLSTCCPAVPVAAALPVVAPAPAAAAPSSPVVAWYRVAYLGGISVRQGPSYAAPKTGATLGCNEIVGVSEEVPSPDGCVYLRLSDGRGWVFDDSALMPQDPSVVRGHWQATPAAPPAAVAWAPAEASEIPEDEHSAASVHTRRRRKRGGVRRMAGVRRRRALEEAAAVAAGADDAQEESEEGEEEEVEEP